MIFRKADVPFLKWPLLTFIATVCAGILSVMLSLGFARHKQEERVAAQDRLRTVRAALASAMEDKNDLQTYRQEYDRLLAHGVIGDEHRLEWIDYMEDIRRQHRAPDFSYTILPRHPYPLPPGMSNGQLESGMSDMAIHLDLLHDGQLLDFLDYLHSGASGLFILNGCTVGKAIDESSTSLLAAECSGGWMTLTMRKTI